MQLDVREDSIYVPKSENLTPFTLRQLPFPGFATDLQQPITPLLTLADGESVITETIYPERTRHIPELQKLGVAIENLNMVKLRLLRVITSMALVWLQLKFVRVLHWSPLA